MSLLRVPLETALPHIEELVPFAEFCIAIHRSEPTVRKWLRDSPEKIPLKTVLIDGRRYMIVPGGDAAAWDRQRIAAKLGEALA